MEIPQITKKDSIVVLTGAGISAESGIRTFRDSDGLWENHRVEDVATPEGFKRNPTLVWSFYKERYAQSQKATPNAGHLALVELEKAFTGRFTLITQNVDGLHTCAGSKHLYEMHGTLYKCYCTGCRQKFGIETIDMAKDIPHCSLCGAMLRPDIVWFGEMPYYMDEIYSALQGCTIFISIGTSGQVYPAAYFIAQAREAGASTIAVNLDPPENNAYADYFLQGKAGEILPQLVKNIIGE